MDNLGVDLSQQAQVHFLHGNYSESALLYEQAIAAKPDIRTNYWHLGIALLLLEQEEEAQIVWFSAISEGNEEQVGEWTQELVEVLIASAQNQQEAENYLGEWLLRQHIRHINCDYSDGLTNELYLILAAIRSDRLSRREFSDEELDSSFLPAIQLLSDNFAPFSDNHLLLKVYKHVKAHSLFLSEIFRKACLEYYNSKIEQTPEDAVLWCFLGNIYAEYRNYQQEDWQKAQLAYEKAISLAPNFAEAYYHYSNLLLDRYNRSGFPLSPVIKCVEKAIALSPKYGDALYRLGTLLEAHGKSQESLSCFKKALETNLQNLKAYRRYHLLLPLVYESFADIHFWRSRFENGLKKFDESISLDKLSDRINALQSIECRTIFLLPYQGYNDLDLQRQYGQILQRVMAANYPQWSQPLSMPELSNSNESKGKLRIGYVSSYFVSHSVGMMAMGYFKHCDHERFEIYAYHTGSMNGYDSITEQFREYSHAFYHIPESLEVVCEQIRFDDLHILIFLDIGMDKNTNPIAGLRLAPVQCVWAGHPDTTGLSTIDYFLSSDAHEIEDAQQHYSEKLIRLPNLSHVYTKSSIPDLNKTRSDMGLPEDVPIYVSCQMPFKYLPQYDYLFPEILKRVPSAKVVFCLGGKDDILAQFVENRIKNAFKRSGLDSEISCIFLGRLEFNDYLNLLSICDASLDTIGFTGSNTTLQAIACGLPVVTLPTELMRGRQSYGIFKTLGVMDTVASSEAEYIEIAVRLCSDSAWRESIIQKMKANHHMLYDDITCVKALEQFFVEVVSDYSPIE